MPRWPNPTRPPYPNSTKTRIHNSYSRSRKGLRGYPESTPDSPSNLISRDSTSRSTDSKASRVSNSIQAPTRQVSACTRKRKTRIYRKPIFRFLPKKTVPKPKLCPSKSCHRMKPRISSTKCTLIRCANCTIVQRTPSSIASSTISISIICRQKEYRIWGSSTISPSTSSSAR